MWIIVILTIVVIKILSIYTKTPVIKDESSEGAVASILATDSVSKKSGRILRNIYIPKPSGDTTEIDILYIARKGILVLEDKDYAGYIFGSESKKNWTVTLFAGKTFDNCNKIEKYKFYNPVWQNRNHIKWLKEYLNINVRAFSIVTFSDRGNLKSISINSPDVYICNHSTLYAVLKEIWNKNPDVLTDEQIEELYEKLLQLTNVDIKIKQKHIEDIHNRFNSTDICPVCGGQLVLRTIKKGSKSGKQFYGCTNVTGK